MSGRPQKLLLLLIALSLAVAPLRGALALPAPATGDSSETHCASMQHPADMPDGQDMQDTAHTGHPCQAGCNGDCCHGACNPCGHPAKALFDTDTIASASHPVPLQPALSARFSDRTDIPPLRPPASA